ncbi:MAG TPA: GNAT family protein [Candidatus Cybelea sp.]|jgi:RimJ/RimL family protein N-acetyltransferase|nr:GNAT family protein [Candidatus Cybelea sp.]
MLQCDDAVTLRAPRADDADTLTRNANHRSVWINLRDRMPHPYTRDDAARWIRSVEDEHPRTSFSIVVDGAVAGGIGLVIGTDIERWAAEVGYWLGPEYWGRGIATTALRCVCRYAFDDLGLLRIFATPMAWNPASFRVLEKAGFRREGIMRNACVKDGRLTDMVLYAKTP